MQGEWKFVSNLNAVDSGLNDAGIETFSGDSQRANIREVIQNSIDQISDYARKDNLPVVVEFDYFTIDKENFYGYEQFKDILGSCKQCAEDDANVRKFFEQAMSLMDKPINVLRISDFNTTGLVGAETGLKGTPWHNLIKAQGSSNKNMNSGGSFGIGKSAPFACSNLRTVFYASKVDDIYSYIGVSRLISHQEGDEMTIGTGFYSDNDKLMAIFEPFSLNEYKRTTNGTDIYIMGYEGDGDIKELLKEATLENFFISIHKGLLVVKYKDIEINSGNLGQYIAELDDEQYSELKTYYSMLVSEPSPDDEDRKIITLDSKEYGEKFGITDGECTLLLFRGDNLNRRILMTRKPGMSLFEQTRISGSISFTGILLITGDKMNEIFKNMEVPAHDAWKPDRCKVDKQMYQEAYAQLRDYLRNKVNEYFGQTQEDTIPAYGMEDFFSGIELEDGKKETSVLDGDSNITVKRNKIDNKVKDAIKGNKKGIDDPDPIPPIPWPPGPGPRPKHKRKYKFVNIKKRLVIRDEANGEYSLFFKTNKTSKHIKLDLFGLAEKGTYDLSMKDVTVQGIPNPKFEVIDNSVVIDNVQVGSNIQIDFRIDFDRRCNMGVNYDED